MAISKDINMKMFEDKHTVKVPRLNSTRDSDIPLLCLNVKAEMRRKRILNVFTNDLLRAEVADDAFSLKISGFGDNP